MNKYDVFVKVIWKWKAVGMAFFGAGSNYDGILFYVGTPEGAPLRSPCQACRRFRGKASASCIPVDANVLRPVRENTVQFCAGHLALNGSRSEHLLQPHGSHFFFYVLLTVHLSTILVIDQLNAQNLFL